MNPDLAGDAVLGAVDAQTAREANDVLYQRYRDLLRDAMIAEGASRADAAFAAYHAAAAIAPGRVLPWLGVARMAVAAGDDATARSAYRAVLEIDPEDAEARAGLARLRTSGRATRGTPPRTDEATGAHPIRVDWLAEDAIVRDLANRWDAAREAEDAAALADIAWRLLDLGRLDAARDVVLDLLQVAPTMTLVHRLVDAVGTHRSQPVMRRWVETLRRYEAVTDDPVGLDLRRLDAEDAGDVAGLVDVAEAHRRRGRPYPAMEALAVALRMRPTDPGVHAAIARVRLERWHVDRVLVDLDLLARILELDGDPDGRGRVRHAVVECLLARSSVRRPPEALAG